MRWQQLTAAANGGPDLLRSVNDAFKLSGSAALRVPNFLLKGLVRERTLTYFPRAGTRFMRLLATKTL